MKNLAVVIVLALICVLFGCNNSISPSNGATPIETSGSDYTKQEDKSAESTSAEKNWTEDEIKSLFIKANKNENRVFTIIDSVVIPDFAYDRVGAVLYVDNENQTIKVAFMDADGYYQAAGPRANLCGDSEFTYCGNGTVSFKLETENGVAYAFKLTITIEDSNVTFIAQDDLDEITKNQND